MAVNQSRDGGGVDQGSGIGSNDHGRNMLEPTGFVDRCGVLGKQESRVKLFDLNDKISGMTFN